MENTCCGYLQFPEQWFDNEPENEHVRTFSLWGNLNLQQLKDESSLSQIRTFWLSRIQSIYGNSFSDSLLLNFYDTKTNPRRIHPFAHIYISWVNKVFEFLHGETDHAPVCVMKRLVLPSQYLICYKNGLPLEMKDLLEYKYYDGYPSLVRIQRWWRYRKLPPKN